MNMRNLFLTLAFGLCSGVFAQNTTVFESPIIKKYSAGRMLAL